MSTHKDSRDKYIADELGRPLNQPSKTLPVTQFLDPKQQMVLQHVGKDAPAKTKLFSRVYGGTASPRQAIKAKCFECVGMDNKAVRECSATECPLWFFRPFQRSGVYHDNP